MYNTFSLSNKPLSENKRDEKKERKKETILLSIPILSLKVKEEIK
jgi:hypothetical protein